MGKSQNKFRLNYLAAVASVGLLLAGCSSSAETKSYGSLSEVKAAYESAGGTCVSTTPFSAFTESYGIHGINCGNNDDAMAWFETDKAKSDFLEIVTGSGRKYVLGANWLLLTENAEKFFSSMGGSVKG